jgi:hypothetical protein
MIRTTAVAVLLLCACGGEGWKKTTALPGTNPGCISLLLDGDVIFVGHSQGLSKSTDDGATWSDSSNGLPHPGGASTGISPVEALLVDQDAILAGTDDGTYASMDNGATWVNANAGMPSDVSPYAFALVGTVALVGMNTGSHDSGRTGGVFRSPDQGVSWAQSSTGLSQTDGAISFAQLGGKVFTCFGMTIASSTDKGQTWTISASPGMSNCLWLEQDGTNLYAATASAGVFRSTDGTNWTAASKGLPTGEIVSTLLFNAGKLYAGTDKSGVFVSSDTGKSWSKLSDGFSSPLPRVVQFVVHGTSLIAITEADGVWKRAL